MTELKSIILNTTVKHDGTIYQKGLKVLADDHAFGILAKYGGGTLVADAKQIGIEAEVIIDATDATDALDKNVSDPADLIDPTVLPEYGDVTGNEIKDHLATLNVDFASAKNKKPALYELLKEALGEETTEE